MDKKIKTMTDTKKVVKKSTMPPQADYHNNLIVFLKDINNATAYLNAALVESLKGDEESKKLFLMALRHVAQAQGSMSALAKRAHLRRENLYKILSASGNPEFLSLTALLYAMGFGLSVTRQ